MAKIFKVLSALLSYPDAEIVAAAPALREAAAAEKRVSAPVRAGLVELVDQLATHDPYDLEERYVLLFDRTRSLSLHLFEHVHGEGRDRGQAMVDLAARYERHGLAVLAGELPDYLPMFLEFLSTVPPEEGRALLGQPLHIVAALGERLRKRNSIYRWVFAAIGELARSRPDAGELRELMAEPDDDPDDLVALDAAWQDAPVTFGPDAGAGCNQAADMVRRMGSDLEQPGRAGARPPERGLGAAEAGR
jgi:nitrate reductase delta subunit